MDLVFVTRIKVEKKRRDQTSFQYHPLKVTVGGAGMGGWGA